MALAVKGNFYRSFSTEDATVDKILWMDFVHPQSKFLWTQGHVTPIIVPESGKLSLRVNLVALQPVVTVLAGFTLEESRLRYRVSMDAAYTTVVDGNFHTVLQIEAGSGMRIAVLDYWIAFSGVAAGSLPVTCQLARTSGSAGMSTAVDADYVEILNGDEVGV
jgi:hypothetical protein